MKNELGDLNFNLQAFLAGGNGAPSLTTLVDSLFKDCKDDLYDTVELEESTRAAFPDGHILLTETLLDAISQYGIDKNTYILNEQALTLIKHSKMMRLAHMNSHALIYRLNKDIEAQKAKKEAEDKQKEYQTFLKAIQAKETADEALAQKAKALGRFLYYVGHPHEEMEKSFEDFFDDIGKDETLLVHIYNKYGKDKWDFSNTLYKYYSANERMRGFEKFKARLKTIEGSTDLEQELKAVRSAHAHSKAKTNNQALWMALGALAFAMEIVLLPLENLALMSTMGGWAILGISFASCLVFGPLIAMFFHTAHYEELKRQNQLEHYENNYLKDRGAALPPHDIKGVVVSKGGTYTEALTIFSVLTTLGTFAALDMVALGTLGGNYNSALPGTFFYNKVLSKIEMAWTPELLLLMVSLVAIAAIVYTAYKAATALREAHDALDGKETREFFNKMATKTEMRRTIKTNDTEKPLLFSRYLLIHRTKETMTELTEYVRPTNRVAATAA